MIDKDFTEVIIVYLLEDLGHQIDGGFGVQIEASGYLAPDVNL